MGSSTAANAPLRSHNLFLLAGTTLRARWSPNHTRRQCAYFLIVLRMNDAYHLRSLTKAIPRTNRTYASGDARSRPFARLAHHRHRILTDWSGFRASFRLRWILCDLYTSERPASENPIPITMFCGISVAPSLISSVHILPSVQRRKTSSSWTRRSLRRNPRSTPGMSTQSQSGYRG